MAVVPMLRSKSTLLLALFLIPLGCSAKEEGPSESTIAECMDGIDNDADGHSDCADTGCARHVMCGGGMFDAGGGGDIDTGVPPIRDAGPFADAGPLPMCNDPLDVAFVLDVSTSMADELDAIRRGLRSIWDAAAVLTTSTRFGMVVFVDDTTAVNGCAAF